MEWECGGTREGEEVRAEPLKGFKFIDREVNAGRGVRGIY